MKRLTAEILIQDVVYEQLSDLAVEMQVSYSELLILAINDFLHRHYKQKLQESMNVAYEDGLDSSEQDILERMRFHQRQLTENEL